MIEGPWAEDLLRAMNLTLKDGTQIYNKFKSAFEKKDYINAFSFIVKNPEIVKHFSAEEREKMKDTYLNSSEPKIKKLKLQLDKIMGW